MVRELKPILVATHNIDKYALASALLRKAGVKLIISSLDEIGVQEVIEERGTIAARASAKALGYGRIANSRYPFRFDYVLGIDVGISVTSVRLQPEDSQRVTTILLGKQVATGEHVMLRQAFAFSKCSGPNVCFTFGVPFTYVGGSKRDVERYHTYPLMRVLSIPGDATPLVDLAFEQYVDHFWQYCRRPMIRTLRTIGIS